MKLSYFQLEPHLTKNLARIYIVSGEELLLKNDAIQLIRKTAKQTGFSERIRLAPEAGFDWEKLYSILYSGSLLADKRLIELDFRDTLPNKTASKILQDYAANPSPDNLILIDIGKVDDKISKSAWYKALEKVGVVVTIWPVTKDQLPQWICNRAKKYKIQFNLDAANLLADYIEGNLIAASQAIEKIYLLRPQKAIDIEIVETILTDESRFSVFDLVENLIGGNKSRALHILETLQNDGTEPVLILWAITRELRLLAELAQELKQGSNHESLFQKHRIFAKRQAPMRRFLNKFSAENCWESLKQAAELDRVIKGAVSGNVWDSLQMLCLRVG
jgi:DNA polymerase III subunit delta